MEEKVTYRTISTSDPMFTGRLTRLYTIGPGLPAGELLHDILVPDGLVLCNGCNENQYPGTVDAIHINGRLYDVYCPACRRKYFPQAEKREL